MICSIPVSTWLSKVISENPKLIPIGGGGIFYCNKAAGQYLSNGLISALKNNQVRERGVAEPKGVSGVSTGLA
jgi:hypothetical protein